MIISDMDGTLLARWSPGDYAPRRGPSPHRRVDAILTNQGGVALRWAGLPWARQFYGLKTAVMRARFALRRSGARYALLSVYSDKQLRTWRGRIMRRVGTTLPPVHLGGGVFVSLDPRHHKPAPGGLWWLVDRIGPALAEPIHYIGDSGEDRVAARAANIDFIYISML